MRRAHKGTRMNGSECEEMENVHIQGSELPNLKYRKKQFLCSVELEKVEEVQKCDGNRLGK